MSYFSWYRDYILTKLANSDRRAQIAYIEHFKKLSSEFDALIAEFDADPTDEAFFAIVDKYKYIYTSILSAECGVYTTWYCYLAIRPYTKTLRRRMRHAIVQRFGKDIFEGELNLLSILATVECATAVRRAELRKMGDIKIPEGVTEITTTSLARLRIKKLYLPDSLVEICNHAFSMNPIKRVSIGRNVRKIGEYAFGSGRRVLYIDFRGHMQEWYAIEQTEIVSPWVKAVITCLDGKIVQKPKKK